MTAAALQTQFGISDILRFEEAPNGLVRAVVASPQACATVYLHGAHVTSWTPQGERDMLFVSSASKFASGMPIRGGVPLVFPWFGPRSDGASGPMHGFARVIEWRVESAILRPDGAVELTLVLEPDDVSRALGYDWFELRFRVAVGATLEMELKVHNQGEPPLRFENALHTYFAVADIERVSVTGLEGAVYIDKAAAFARKESRDPIRISGETDRVYLNTAATCEIVDPGWERTIIVEKTGSDTTVVWNPWIEKNQNLADMAPDDWRNMLCVETANASDNAVVLAGGGTHRMQTTLRLKSARKR